MNKKGTHVGVVLSFVIFVTFLILIYLIIQPSLKVEEKQHLANLVETEFIGRSSADLTTTSIGVSTSSGCVVLKDIFTLTDLGSNLRIINNEGESISGGISGNHLVVSRTNEVLIKIQESSEFPAIGTGNPGSCQDLTENNNYDIGLIKTEEHLFETKILETINYYETNYGILKTEFNVVETDNFGLGFKYTNGTTVETETPLSTISIYAIENSIQYVSEEGVIKIGYLIIRAW